MENKTKISKRDARLRWDASFDGSHPLCIPYFCFCCDLMVVFHLISDWSISTFSTIDGHDSIVNHGKGVRCNGPQRNS